MIPGGFLLGVLGGAGQARMRLLDEMEERMRAMVMMAVVLGVGCLSSAALAEETAKKVGPGRYEIKIDIVAKPQRPMASIEVTKLPVTSTLSALRQPLVGRIEHDLDKSPF